MGKKKRCKGLDEKEGKEKFRCKKCGLKATKEKHLCKPEEK